MTKCLVLKEFPLSVDGVTSVDYVKDDQAEVPDRLIAGLAKEGYLQPPAGWTPPAKLAKNALPAKRMTPPAPPSNAESAANIDQLRGEVDALREEVADLRGMLDAMPPVAPGAGKQPPAAPAAGKQA